MTEKRPTNAAAFRYELARNWPKALGVLSQTAWERGKLLVTSSLSEMSPTVQIWHVGISQAGKAPSDEVCQRVLSDFELIGAAEVVLPDVSSRARHFKLRVDAATTSPPYCARCEFLPWAADQLTTDFLIRLARGAIHHPNCPKGAN